MPKKEDWTCEKVIHWNLFSILPKWPRESLQSWKTHEAQNLSGWGILPPAHAPVILCTCVNPSWQIMGALGGKIANNATLGQVQVKVTCPQDASKGNWDMYITWLLTQSDFNN